MIKLVNKNTNVVKEIPEGYSWTTFFFGFLPALSKYVLMFDMLAGRLELFPLLILFHPAIWKDTFKQKIEMRKRKDRLS